MENNNYVDNKELYKQICEWKEKCYKAGEVVKLPDSMENNNYVDNKELYKQICEWKEKCYKAGEVVKLPDSIGQAIMSISEGLTKYYKFSGYTPTWKEEMYWDGIEVAIKGLINFDEKKYFNPHAYITKACFNAFIQRIKKEKKEMAVKYSYFVHNVYDEYDEDMTRIADEDFVQDIYDKLVAYEVSRTNANKKKEEPEGPTLDYLYE